MLMARLGLRVSAPASTDFGRPTFERNHLRKFTTQSTHISAGFEAPNDTIHRGRPLGDDAWVESIARRLNLESTMRPRGRQKVRSQQESSIKDA